MSNPLNIVYKDYLSKGGTDDRGKFESAFSALGEERKASILAKHAPQQTPMQQWAPSTVPKLPGIGDVPRALAQAGKQGLGQLRGLLDRNLEEDPVWASSGPLERLKTNPRPTIPTTDYGPSMQAMPGVMTGSGKQMIGAIGGAVARGFSNPRYVGESEKEYQKMYEEGGEQYEKAMEPLKDLSVWNPKRAIPEAMGSVVKSAPGIVAGVAGGIAAGPPGALAAYGATIGATAGMQKMQEAKDNGLSYGSQLLVGGLSGALEAGTEMVPMHALLKQWGNNFVKRGVEFLLKDMGMEGVAEAGDWVIDKAAITPETTYGDMVNRVEHAMAIAPWAAGAQAGIVKGTQFAVDQAAKAVIKKTGQESRANKIAKGIHKRSFDTVPKDPLTSAYDAYTGLVGKGYDHLANNSFAWWHPLGKLPEWESYINERMVATGNQDKATQDANNILKDLAQYPDDADAIEQFLTTKTLNTVGIKNKQAQKKAREVKDLIFKQGQEAVNRGLLSHEAFTDKADAYLPRKYLRYILESDFGGKGISSGLGKAELGWTQKRKEIPEEYRRLVLGQIRDPAVLASVAVKQTKHDFAVLDFLENISQNENWVHPDSLVEWSSEMDNYSKELEGMGLEGYLPKYRGAEQITYSASQEVGQAGPLRAKQFVSGWWMREEADHIRRAASKSKGPQTETMNRIAHILDEIVDKSPKSGLSLENFKPIPNKKRYGRLAGMYLRKEIYNDIIQTYENFPQDFFSKHVLGPQGAGAKINRTWKKLHVPFNPPTQVRNFVSNGVMMYMADVPGQDMLGLLHDAAKDINKNGPYWKAAVDHGIQGSTFTSEELTKFNSQLAKIRAEQGGIKGISWGAMHKVAEAVDSVKEKLPLSNAGPQLYQRSESLFKTAAIIHRMRKGDSPTDAARFANETLFDYSLVPQGVRMARNVPFGMPFATFYYKAIPRILEALAKRPHKFLPFYLIPKLFEHEIAENEDVTEEDVKRLREFFPKHIKEKRTVFLYPYKDPDNRWQVVDFSYFLPWSAFEQIAFDVHEAELRQSYTQTGVLSGPIPQISRAFATGVDSFTGKPIIRDGMTPNQKLGAMLGYSWGLIAPPILTQHGMTGKLIDRYSGNINPYTFEQPLTWKQGLLRGVGLNVYPTTPEVNYDLNIRAMSGELKDIRREMKRALSDPNLERDQEAWDNMEKEFEKIIEAKVEEIEAYEERAKLHPNLTTK